MLFVTWHVRAGSSSTSDFKCLTQTPTPQCKYFIQTSFNKQRFLVAISGRLLCIAYHGGLLASARETTLHGLLLPLETPNCQSQPLTAAGVAVDFDELLRLNLTTQVILLHVACIHSHGIYCKRSRYIWIPVHATRVGELQRAMREPVFHVLYYRLATPLFDVFYWRADSIPPRSLSRLNGLCHHLNFTQRHSSDSPL